MSLNLQKYHAFAILLEQLRSDIINTQLDELRLPQRVASLQQFFGQEIIPLADEESREQMYKTEMSKQLRLLEVDMMFFQGAKQPATAKTRLNAIGDRLTTLIQYCSAVVPQEGSRE